MGEFKYANLRYCSLLKRNVVFENYYDVNGERVCECIYKQLCNYDECGCRNALFANTCVIGFNGAGSANRELM